MKTMLSRLCAIAAALLSLTLAGCAAERPAMHGGSGGGAMGAGMGMGMMDSDMSACRDMHEKMAAAKTPEERQAIMHERMQSMTPEMRQRMQEHMSAKRCQ